MLFYMLGYIYSSLKVERSLASNASPASTQTIVINDATDVEVGDFVVINVLHLTTYVATCFHS